ncbi:DNA-directed RNA polymerase III subunit RPC3 [Bradysia coprophila]|uniref:DNA-directed RNA polymerase III subunit RPC3 n=1 Tax=Bradysia coprophila TaxID=38358 RepID=UPI00187DD636|nr:DNA-directed RNA polymerase III subunit RPC3 [Bradysia coprophila]
MSIQLAKLCSIIFERHFGKNVQIVGDCLFAAIQSRSLSMIVKNTGLPRSDVAHALAILIKFRLVKFDASANESFAEYSLNRDSILLILRFPRYVHLIQTKFGMVAAALVEELLRSGSQTASKLIAHCFDSKTKTSLTEHRDAFNELCQSMYVFRAPVVANKEQENVGVPRLQIDEHNLFATVDLDLNEITKLKEDSTVVTKDKDVYWMVNTDRFHQEFRDELILSAVERKINPSASEVMKHILHQMYLRTKPWEPSSNPIPFVEIRQLVEKESSNLELIKYLDQYVSIIMDDQLKFLAKYGDMGGGQYVVQMKYAVEQLTWVCIENIITEKFGSKASRIFRVVRLRKFSEQEDIQKEAMVPSKEAKLFTYKLLEEHFLQTKTVRKPGGGGTGMAKSFFLFYVSQTQIVSMLLEICYKALFNSMTRSAYNKSENRRLIDKSQRLDGIVEAMKDRGESEEYIAEIHETLTPPEREVLQKVKTRIKNLDSAEIGLDETIFLFQLYENYKN